MHGADDGDSPIIMLNSLSRCCLMNVWLCVSVSSEKLVFYFFFFWLVPLFTKYVQFWKLALCDVIKKQSLQHQAHTSVHTTLLLKAHWSFSGILVQSLLEAINRGLMMLFPGDEASSGNKQSDKNVPGVQDAKYKSERGKNMHNVLIARTHILLKKKIGGFFP